MSANPAVPKIVCVTPIRNEAWILETFLTCASVWADEIVLADQDSTDGSRELAAKFPKVRVVRNEGLNYDEAARQRLLLRASRERAVGPQVLLALDADELLIGKLESLRSNLGALQPGTVIEFEWRNLLPDRTRYWVGIPRNPLGYVDDGRPHSSSDILHSTRVPVGRDTIRIPSRGISVLHLQFLDWERMRSKQRGYLCQERLLHPWKRPIALNRAYRHMDAITESDLKRMEPSDLASYRSQGIDPFTYLREGNYRWDLEVGELLASPRWKEFRHLDVWDDWCPPEPHKAAFLAHRTQRGAIARLLIRYQRRTQRWHRSKVLRAFDALISLVVCGTLGKPPAT